jgi:hypothetical protein
MASPLHTPKQAVDLATTPKRVSRIRRDPPPKVKEVTIADRDERDARIVVIGVIAFALAVVIVIVGLSSAFGWSPRQYTAHL